MDWNGLEWIGMDWDGLEWNGFERIGIDWNIMDRNGLVFDANHIVNVAEIVIRLKF